MGRVGSLWDINEYFTKSVTYIDAQGSVPSFQLYFENLLRDFGSAQSEMNIKVAWDAKKTSE